MQKAVSSLFLFTLLIASSLAGCTGRPATPTPAALSARNQATVTPLPTDTAVPTAAHSPTPDYTPTPGPSPTASNTPTSTPPPTNTPIPSVTPTSKPQFAPTLAISQGVIGEGVATPATVIPSPVPTFEAPRGVTNVLLMGSDEPLETGGVRSDTIIIASINHESETAAMISIPRDLYVYIPGRTMAKITSASQLGGVELLKQTILYNFGVPIHYHARVDFEGFQEIVDAIGGVDIAVDCELTSWRLKSPDLDPEEEDNWELFTLEPGVHHMDGDLALWYARARKGVPLADWDRGRRQQKLLRALFNQGIDLNLVAQVPSLWEAFRNTVETDIDIGRVLQLAALAPAVRENGIQHLYLAGKTRGGTIVTEEGVELSVNYPVWEGEGMMQDTFARLSRPPALNRSTGPAITVEIVNGSGDEDMAVLAADNLAWYGFAPTVSTETPEEPVESTTLTYFGPNFKGAYEWIISWIFHMDAEDIIIKEGDASPYNYQVILGQDYDSCLQNQIYYSP